ncbi:MAG: hypothetical protein KBC91_04290 [Candidatus Omnitrophica bacterium]|nr:hypothetical protein [Candidatus Omnitrophota bacterium]
MIPIRAKQILLISVFVFGGFAWGCAAAPKMPPEAFLTATPLPVLGLVSVPVGIGKLDPVMPVGKKVGDIYNNFGKATAALRSGVETRGAYRKYFYEELRKAGYETAGNETIFEARDLAKARIIIGGDIVDAKVNVFQSMKDESIEYAITILWRVFDRQSEREIFEAQTQGAAKDESLIRAEASAFRAAFLKLLAQSNFVDALAER